jgi:hypothetical protein
MTTSAGSDRWPSRGELRISLTAAGVPPLEADLVALLSQVPSRPDMRRRAEQHLARQGETPS